jgi:2-C-methyl-D-erythritol 4-phosphate cytidylyltransferase
MTVVGVIAAGGRGERLGADRPKALVVVQGKPLVDWSRAVLDEVCDRVIVAGPPQTSDLRPQTSEWVEGGSSRSASVRNALLAAPEASVVVVHDAARPFVTVDLVERCVEGLEGFDAAVAAAPVTDTVKEADASGRVLRTLDRSALWAIQTPQVFRADVLRRALDVGEEVLAGATDDASLVEAAGGAVRVVEAPAANFKITTREDLERAEALLAH